MRLHRLFQSAADPIAPKRSLQTSAVIAVTALVTVTTALCGWLTTQLTIEAMRQSLLRSIETLSASAVEISQLPLSHDGDRELTPMLKPLLGDHRVAFVVVSDVRGRVVANLFNEPVAWTEYQRQVTPQDRRSPITLNHTLELRGPDSQALLVRRLLVLRASPNPQMRTQPPITPIGCVEIGLLDAPGAKLARRMQDATITVVALINLIAVPLVILWARGWTRPIRRIVAATQQLSMGQPLPALDDARKDEIGLLSRSFNGMARSLSSIQEALLMANAQLEGKVTQRTSELEQANARLRQEMDEKDQFLRAVSHDLGAPLRNIEGLTRILMLKHRDEMADEVVAKLERISANVKTENELINDLLELSRLRNRHGRLVEIDLNDDVRNIGESMSVRCRASGPSGTGSGRCSKT